MRSFFDADKYKTKKKTPTLSRCGECGLSKGCHSPKMKVTGKGKKRILIIAEAPGREEDERGEQLIGDAGRTIRKVLKKYGIDIDRDCWKTNAVICRPPKNRKPKDKEIAACRPNLVKTIKKLKPCVIIPLGSVAVNSLLPIMWKEGENASIGRWQGWEIPCQTLNTWICPTYHPSYLNRTHDPVAESLFRRHIKRAVAKKKKPWSDVKPPDYKNRTELIFKPSKAIKAIKSLTKECRNAMAFDYETNCLKPEVKGSYIASCSICFDGDNTIAFPWTKRIAEVMADVLTSPIPKIGACIKFEERWTWNKLGVHVNGWEWDTVIAAHVIDNRPLITSVKFQSFVLLGTPHYTESVDGYLSCPPGELNRIDDIPLKDLLLYNGIDSDVEYAIAIKQMARMKKQIGSKG